MSQKEVKRLLLCGGGTGGHITPSLAVAEEFCKRVPESEVLFVVSQNAVDAQMMQSTSFDYKKIHTGKLRRYFSLENFVDFFRFFWGIGESFVILLRFKPDVIFSKGGFVALPVALAAKLLSIPVIAHESDTVPGLANRIIEKFAKKVCHSFPSKTGFVTGTPVRQQILNGNKEKGGKFLHFSQTKPIILFMGASQGAQQINDLCEVLLSQIQDIVNIVLISGKGKTLDQNNSDSFQQFEHLGIEFADVLAAADMVVSRSGANSLFELAALKKASILIPLDSSAGDHQRKNAQSFAEKNAAVLIDPLDKDIEEKTLACIQQWIKNPKNKEQYQETIYTLFEKDAVKNIVDVILDSEKL